MSSIIGINNLTLFLQDYVTNFIYDQAITNTKGVSGCCNTYTAALEIAKHDVGKVEEIAAV
jgi:hypothetical protein